jgi:hypothetical protein
MTHTQTAGTRVHIGYAWTVTGGTAAHFLTDVRPYLIIKPEQADLALQFQDRVENYQRSSELEPEEVAARKMMKDQLSRLKTAFVRFTQASPKGYTAE